MNVALDTLTLSLISPDADADEIARRFGYDPTHMSRRNWGELRQRITDATEYAAVQVAKADQNEVRQVRQMPRAERQRTIRRRFGGR